MTDATYDVASLKSLRDRVRAAKGADRELDYAIEACLKPWLAEQGYVRNKGDGWRSKTPSVPGAYLLRGPARYTASIDAVAALIAKELPSCSWTAHSYGLCAVDRCEHGLRLMEDGSGATPALGLLDALIGCLIARASRWASRQV